MEQIKLRTGMKVLALSNSEHRFMSYRAVASQDNFDAMVSESAAIVDIGGASLQITLFYHGRSERHSISVWERSSWREYETFIYMTNHKEQIAQMMYKELDAFVTMHMQDVKLKYLIILGDHVSTLMERAVDDATREPIQDGALHGTSGEYAG